MLGKIVKVKVDRPLGTYHPTYKNIYYSVNYGYVPQRMAPDGEEQDVYILGVNKPIKEFEGRVIAIIHRFDDVEEKWVVAPEGVPFTKEDKWVVAPDGMVFTKEEIMQLTAFQECFFKSEIIM